MVATKEKPNHRGLSAYEQETIISFNKEEKTASVFTYEKTWQRHFEQRLGLKPVMDNGFGGREYQLPKDRIRPPRATMRLTGEARKARAQRLSEVRKEQKRLFV